MIIFTNRHVVAEADESAYLSSFTPGASKLSYANVSSGNKANKWILSNVSIDVTDKDVMEVLIPLFKGKKPVLVFIHGNNNSPSKCFERCSQLESLYGFPVVGFSWASEGLSSTGDNVPGVLPPVEDDETDLDGVNEKNRTDSAVQSKIRRFRQAKNNAQDSIDALARFLRMLGAARLYTNQQPFSLAAHSLGAFFLQYSLEVPGATEAVSSAQNIALIAACVRASGHRDWIGKIRPKGQVFVTYNKADSVLLAASIADGGQIKLGATPDDILVSKSIRYISFTGAKVNFGGHRYFMWKKMPKKTINIFKRIFGSDKDIHDNEYPRDVYPVGCDEGRSICYMAAPEMHLNG